jgi:1,4-alpha-glucan branching enzyme
LIGGNFNDWNPTPMKRDKKGVWKTSLNLAPGTYQYGFSVDGQWQSDPSSTDFMENPFGTFNCVKKEQ